MRYVRRLSITGKFSMCVSCRENLIILTKNALPPTTYLIEAGSRQLPTGLNLEAALSWVCYLFERRLEITRLFLFTDH